MCLALQDYLWEILETEACERYFINEAEKPAFLLLHKHNPLTHGSFELYMNHVSRIAKVKTRQKAIQRLDDMLRTARTPMTVYVQKKKGLTYEGKKLYATIDPKLPIKEGEG